MTVILNKKNALLYGQDLCHEENLGCFGIKSESNRNFGREEIFYQTKRQVYNVQWSAINNLANCKVNYLKFKQRENHQIFELKKTPRFACGAGR